MRVARAGLACLARLACLAGALLALSAPGAPAFAAGSPADREAARSLSGKAYELFEGREYRRAIEMFLQAEARFHAPPHLLYVARAQEKLGLLLAARDTFERIVAERLAADAPAPFKDAQTSARAELTEVTALTPSLVISLQEPAPPGARVLVDGEPLAPADLGRPLPRDPGAHAVVAEAPGHLRAERTVVLKAGGGDERVALLLTEPSGSVAPAVVAFSVGAAGVGVGVAGTVLLVQAKPAQTALPRGLAIGGFVAGGAGVVTGAVLLAIRSRAPSAPSAPAAASASVRWQVGVGPGAVSVTCSF